ncbi:Leucine-responsive regulatory protein, partial [Haemophilus influenzae]
AITHSHAEY